MALIEQDPDSYLNATAANGGVWSPSLPQRNGQVGDDFTVADLLTIAGVDPDSRGQ